VRSTDQSAPHYVIFSITPFVIKLTRTKSNSKIHGAPELRYFVVIILNGGNYADVPFTLHFLTNQFNKHNIFISGPDSSVGIATRYGLDGPRIESRCGRDFPHASRPASGLTHPPIQ
jgi:hypothetical protein